MNPDTFQSHLVAIDAGNAAHIAIFRRATAIWHLAQSLLREYESHFREADMNSDSLDSLFENAIFAHSDRRPHSISLDGANRKATLYLRQPYGEHWTDPISFPYEWLAMTDAELSTHFGHMLNKWLKEALLRQAERETEEKAQRKALWQDLKSEFEG